MDLPSFCLAANFESTLRRQPVRDGRASPGVERRMRNKPIGAAAAMGSLAQKKTCKTASTAITKVSVAELRQ
jgi:hypothetical protein